MLVRVTRVVRGLFGYACLVDSHLDHSCLKCVGVDGGHLADLELWGGGAKSSMAGALLWNAASAGKCDVCLHLALFR